MDEHETSPVSTPAPPAPDAKLPTPPQEKPAASAPPEPAAEPDEGTFADNQYSRQQLVKHARELAGAEPFELEVALRHAGDQDYFTIEEAKAAVKELLEATGNEDPDADTEGEDA